MLIARLVLAAVFALAGVAKLADVAGSRRAARDFGVPAALAAAVGTLLPVAEIAIAVALISTASAASGAVAALSLLAIFVAVVTRLLVRGEEPDCHCFGKLGSSAVGWSTLARSLALAALAGVVVFGGPGGSLTGWVARVGSGELAALAGGVLLVVVIAAQASFSYQLLRQNGRLLGRVDALEATLGAPGWEAVGLPVGASAPGFSVSDLAGETVSLDWLRGRGRSVMLVFSNPGCGPCQALMGELGHWQRQHADRLTIALISQGSASQHQVQSAEHGLRDVLLQDARMVADSYHAFATPSAQLVSTAGEIASPLAQGAEEIRTLLARHLDQPSAPDTQTHETAEVVLR